MIIMSKSALQLQLISELGKSNSKQNKWEFNNNIAIGFTYKDEKFYIDLEDYNRVKKYCWRKEVMINGK